MSPHPIGPSTAPEPPVLDDLNVLKGKMNAALSIAIGTYVDRKNTPFTRFQIAQRIRPLLVRALNLTEKKFAGHFDIAVTTNGIDVIPKTEWAKTLLTVVPIPRK